MSREPEWFGRYQLIRRVSVGGMAEVFHAKSYGPRGFEKEVALKRILPSIAEDTSLLHAFIEEARLAAHLHHRNICTIYELGKTFESYYITMEYIYGADVLALRRRLKQRKELAPPECVAYIGARVAEGLHYAFSLRDHAGRALEIVHRDISPQNVMLSYAGDVKIIDFGIAKVAGRTSQTQVGVVKGKASYMAPEQVESRPLDGRADQFALGIILWELLSGERLFKGDHPVETMTAIRRCSIPSLDAVRPGLPRGLVEAVERTLRRDREERFASAGELAAALEPYALGGEEQGRAKLARWLEELFPEAGTEGPELTEREVRELFSSAEDRGEETTDQKGTAEGTQIFIPDTAQVDLYRAQIEALLVRQRERSTGNQPAVRPLDPHPPQTARVGHRFGSETAWDVVILGAILLGAIVLVQYLRTFT
jgi:serine/threonine protein kinase